MFKLKKDSTRVNILATGGGWELAPKQSNAMIYCLNDYTKIEKYGVQPDILFMMDLLSEKPSIVAGADNLGETIQRINQMRCPFVAPYKYEEIPLSEAFPLEDCVKEFGLPYFTNTIGYMIAYALLKGAKEIQLFGVNQAGSHEYVEERGGVEYWIGIAMGKGVEVTINGKDSQLLKYKGRYNPEGIMYGYGTTFGNFVREKKQTGEIIVKRLLTPPKPISRLVRKIK